MSQARHSLLGRFSPLSKNFFYPGGTLPGNIPSYVERAADAALLTALLAGEFCYVLDTRQVGKSSLMVRTAQGLHEAGQHAAMLDISSIGENLSQEQWYFGLLTSLAVDCDLEAEAEAYWLQNPHLSFVQRWFMALRSVFLPHLKAPLVVFVDEIDAVRKLSFSVDEFFAAIRECHNRRATDPASLQVTFCLMGVATPSDLIQDIRTTPFNIGRRIELHDFSLAEALSLACGLPGNPGKQHEQIKRIWYWTAGHPYLTQKFCQALANCGRFLTTAEIDRLCQEVFVSRQAQEADDNLKFISRQLLFDEASCADILALLRQIQTGKYAALRDDADTLVQRLLLSGVVHATPTTQRLVVRNRIYATVFSAAWIRANMPHAEVRRLQIAVRRGMLRASALWMCFAALVGLTLYQTKRAAWERGRVQQAVYEKDQIKQTFQKEINTAQSTLTRRQQEIATAQVTLTQRQEDLHVTQQHVQELEHKVQTATITLQTQQTAIQYARANLKAQEGRIRSVSKEKTRLVNDMDAMMEPLAMAGFGNELEALHFGLSNVEPALKNHALPPRPAMQVLVDAVCVGITRRVRFVHAGSVYDAAISPDNRQVVTVGASRYAYVWDAAHGTLLQRLAVLPSSDPQPVINSVCYTSDGRWIVTTGADHRVCIWNAKQQGQVQTTPLLDLQAGPAPFSNAALSDDAHLMVTPAENNSIKLWELTEAPNHTTINCHLLRTLSGPLEDVDHFKATVRAVDISHDGRLVAAGGSDHIVHVWDTRTGQSTAQFDHAHWRAIQSVRFNKWGNHVLSAGDDYTARLFGLEDPQGPRGEYHGQLDVVYDIEVGAADLYVATAGQDRCVRIWPFTTALYPLYVLSTHTNTVWGAHFSQDARFLITASDDHTSDLWQFTTPTFSAGDGEKQDVAFSPSSQYVLCSREDGLVTAWDWQTGGHTWHFFAGDNAPGIEPCNHAAFSHDGKWVVTTTGDGSVKLWQPARCTKSVISRTPVRQLQGKTNMSIYTVTYSPDDRWILTTSAEGSAVLWESATGRQVYRLCDPHNTIRSAFFSADGRQIVTASQDGSVRTWDLGRTDCPRQVLLPPNWNEQSGTMRVPIDKRRFRPCAVFSPDGRYILSAGYGHCAYVWDAKTGSLIRSLERHGGALTAVAFSPDGKEMATASADRKVYLWSVAEAVSQKQPVPLYALQTHARDVESVAFSPDGKWLATASRDDTCRVYPATFAGMVQKAHELAQIPYYESRVPEAGTANMAQRSPSKKH